MGRNLNMDGYDSSQYIITCHVMLCYVMLCYVMSCDDVLLCDMM